MTDRWQPPITKPVDKDEMFARMDEEMKRDSKRAEAIMATDPQLPFISALIMARDLHSADRSIDWMQNHGAPFEDAVVFVGSYGKFEFIMRAQLLGLITTDQLLDAFVEWWAHSDPDDTDPRVLPLWYQAWERGGNKTLLDDPAKPLIGHRKYFKVYRGQDLDVPFGCAWSLDKNVAEKFAMGAATRQHGRANGALYEARVAATDILAYLTTRNESEVILDPDTLNSVYVIGKMVPVEKGA